MFKKTKTLTHKDIQVVDSKYSVFELTNFLKQELGLNPAKVILDWLSLRLTNRKITFNEYVLYDLYKPERTKNEKKRYIRDANQYWVRAFEIISIEAKLIQNKTLIYELLEKENVSTPKTLGIVYQSPPKNIAKHIIKNPKELFDLLETHKKQKLFGKLNFGLQSVGVFLITNHTNETITLEGREPMTYKAFFKSVIGKEAFLIQEFIENHAELKKFTPYTCTVRTYNIIRDEGMITPFILIKISVGANIADNFWRKGNIIASINTKTGVIERAMQQDGPILKEINEHPDTKEPLLGFQIPFWNDVLAINAKASNVCKELRYQALDIAITDDGPVVIEVNSNGSFILPQAAYGKGFLTDEVLEFVNRKI